MDIDKYSSDICCQLNECAQSFKEKLRTVLQSDDYARALVSLFREFLTSDCERELWLDRLGLVYCALIIPSELFVAPVKALFSTTGNWDLESTEIVPWGHESPWVNSFFSPGFAIQSGVIEVEFMNALPTTVTPEPRKFVVDENFLAFLDETETAVFDTNDGRFRNFLSHNEQMISDLFPIGDLFQEFAPWYCSAFDELAYIRRLSRLSPQWAYVMHCTDGIHEGMFCFFFRRSLSSIHRFLLFFFSQLLLSYCGTLDHQELERRAGVLHSQLAQKHSAFHSIRTALGTLHNRLQLSLMTNSPGETPSHIRQIQSALDSHKEVIFYLNTLEASGLLFRKSEGDVVTLELLLHHLLSKYDVKDRERLASHVDRKNSKNYFELPGPLPQLLDALSQFVDGALGAPAKHPQGKARLELGLSIEGSFLMITIDAPTELPPYLQEAINMVNIFDRLPSLKPEGGRGLLSAVALIRHYYHGHCDLQHMSVFSDTLCASWSITIPINIIRQLRLFN